MPTYRILFLALSLSIIPVLIAGCCDSASCCGEDLTPQPYYRITAWESRPVRIDTTVSNGYTSITETETLDAVAFNKAGITLAAQVKYYSSLFTGFGALMACSPIPPGEKGSKEIITALTVVSNAGFDDAHPAGSNLADILKIRIKDYISGNISAVQEVTAYLATNPHPAQFYTLLFTKAPELAKKHAFTITYKQSDGQTSTSTTTVLTFK